MAGFCYWSISNNLNNIHMHSPPPLKRRPICLWKTLFELERCFNVMIIPARCLIISARYLIISARCSLISVILMGPLKSMVLGVIVPPAPLLGGPDSNVSASLIAPDRI